MANEDEGFNCCGASPTGAQAAECIVQNLEDRIIPCGTRKTSRPGEALQNDYSAVAYQAGIHSLVKKQGKGVDPICWFTEMGHGPVPADVQIEM